MAIRLISILFILVVFQDFGTGRPYFKRQSEDDEFGKKIDAFYYLSQFGYIDKNDENYNVRLLLHEDIYDDRINHVHYDKLEVAGINGIIKKHGRKCHI